MLTFTRFSKQWYWENHRKHFKDFKDNIFVIDRCSNGGCKWEFMIRQYDFGIDDTQAVRIEMFDDGVTSLKNSRVVKMLVDLKGCSTLDNAEIILRKHKFKEIIEKEDK